MASYTLSPIGGAGSQFFDNSGNVLSGGKLYTYAAGTTTPQTTWTTPAGTIANSNPIVFNSAGRPVNEIWLSFAYSYKFVLKDSNDVLIATYDNIPSLPQPAITNDASSISYEPNILVTAGSFVIGQTYMIASLGTTDFTAIGASYNSTGIIFTAIGAGTGTGTAYVSTTVETQLRAYEASGGSDYIGFLQSGTGALTTETVQDKLRQTVSVKDFGAVGDGVTDDSAAIQATVNYAATIFGCVEIPNGIFRARRIFVPSNVTITCVNGGEIRPLSGTYGYDTAVFELSNVQNVTLSNIRIVQNSDIDESQCVTLENCSNCVIEDSYLECRKLRAISVLGGTALSFVRNTIRLGRGGGAYGVGICLNNATTYCDISDNDISGYKVTKPRIGAGVEPSGDNWGSVAIQTNNGSGFTNTSNGFVHVIGTHVTSGGVTTAVVSMPGVVGDGSWEAAAAQNLDQTTGVQSIRKIFTSIGTNEITISNLVTTPGETITVYALYYKYAPRYLKINNNRITGMTYAGISLITARDVSASGNNMQSIGDIAWDPEGALRCNINGGIITDAGYGAITAGYGCSITGVTFENNYIGAAIVGNNIAYYGLAAGTVLPWGLRGVNSITGCRFRSNEIISIGVRDKSMDFSISNNQITGRVRGIEMDYAYLANINNNDICGQLLIKNSNDVSACGNHFTNSWQYNITLENVTKFAANDNTIIASNSGFGGGTGITYKNCTTGLIKNNTYISMASTSEVDQGGNTNVTVVGGVTL